MKYIVGIIILLLITGIALLNATIRRKLLQESHQKSLKVLFIGNSYTYYNELPNLVKNLALNAKAARKFETEMVTVGGATLEQLWQQGKGVSRIKNGKWDYVVLQEQSTLPITNPKLMYEYARLFNEEIKKINAQTVFYLTWARQNRPETQQALKDSYMTIAQELNAIVAPVGIVWQKIQEQNQNLMLYEPDNSHSSPIGSYVAACVFYATIYGKIPEGLNYPNNNNNSNNPPENNKTKLEELNQIDMTMIQHLAWEVVSRTQS
ncbi:hypothetical protein HCG51_20850 [Tolypothrix sp. PCC 7910]|uniref:DUF4886 domain-containing protein n=1 Tax=Tolypothrix sp. PCC 7910 TaxID=2099387 RepID=UPI001427909D|nr:DUF4886 domain-containing protein [Tolypothrix sp. PCC 7910]QIR38911.1 hypothetical protein HCG51_20850 [Tolypothrix sp. PCC 7910]